MCNGLQRAFVVTLPIQSFKESFKTVKTYISFLVDGETDLEDAVWPESLTGWTPSSF